MAMESGYGVTTAWVAEYVAGNNRPTACYRTRSALFTIIKTINSQERHILYFYYFCCQQLICIVSHVSIINI